MVVCAKHDTFCKRGLPGKHSELKKEYKINKDNQLSIVHPKLYLDKVKRANPGFVLHVALAGAKDALKNHLTFLLRRIGLQKR